ncbi:hypothetical protein D6D04_09862 [Aureobasidium pullulans]|nr:hypothetical protein D6D04_09862 [Aureobasidium pullulans]
MSNHEMIQSMPKFQICINDDLEFYKWQETWKEDTIASFLTRLTHSSSSAAIPLVRSEIHLSFDGVRLGESTIMRENALDGPCRWGRVSSSLRERQMQIVYWLS